MNKYTIVLYNETNDSRIKSVLAVHTFAEAAREAYKIRINKGFNWEIESISKLLNLKPQK